MAGDCLLVIKLQFSQSTGISVKQVHYLGTKGPFQVKTMLLSLWFKLFDKRNFDHKMTTCWYEPWFYVKKAFNGVCGPLLPLSGWNLYFNGLTLCTKVVIPINYIGIQSRINITLQRNLGVVPLEVLFIPMEEILYISYKNRWRRMENGECSGSQG